MFVHENQPQRQGPGADPDSDLSMQSLHWVDWRLSVAAGEWRVCPVMD